MISTRPTIAPDAEAAPRRGSEPFGALLVRRGFVSEDDVAQALIVQADTGKRLGETLVGMGALNERELILVLADLLHMPVVDLRRDNPEPEALALIPEQVVREHMAMPIRLDDDGLQVAVSDQPSVDGPRTARRSRREHPIRFVLAPESDIQWAIDSSYRAIGGVDTLVEAFEAVEGYRKTATETHETEVVADDAPIVQVVTRILTQAKRDRASDVHIEPSQDVVRVRFRIDGALKEVLMLPAAMGVGLVSRIKIMAGMNIVERRRPQDGQLTTADRRQGHRRPGVDGRHHLGREVRDADPRQEPFRPAPPRPRHADGHPRDLLQRWSGRPSGWCCAPGRPGAGRQPPSTPRLGEVSDPTKNVMTIEDPVEYVFPSINQIQTNEQAGLTFATGLKSILRQDPDVILVGEIRDVETARIAVQSALTGHMVLSSLHATDSVSALHRFLDMGIESFLIASSVIAIVGQRLVRRICPSCKTVIHADTKRR